MDVKMEWKVREKLVTHNFFFFSCLLSTNGQDRVNVIMILYIHSVPCWIEISHEQESKTKILNY